MESCFLDRRRSPCTKTYSPVMRVSKASPQYFHSWRLLRKLCGVWISATAKAGTNRAQPGNPPQPGGDAMFATLGQKLAARLLAQVLQHVQLLIELLGSAARSGFGDFFQPLAAMAGVINVP